MPILEELERRYPARIQLAYTPIRHTFRLNGENVLLSAVRSGLEDFALQECIDGPEAEAHLERESGDSRSVLRIVFSGSEVEGQFFFEGEQQATAMLLVLYAFATGEEWLDRLQGKVVSAAILSANQQRMLFHLRATCRQWMSAAPDLQKMIRSAVQEASETLCKWKPVFSKLPLRSSAWQEMKQTEPGFLRPANVQKLEDLLEQNYREEEYLQDVEEFIRLLCPTMENYQRLMKRITDKVCDQLYRLPFARVHAELELAGDRIRESIGDGYMSDGFTFDIKGKFRNLTPQLLQRTLAAREENLNQCADHIISKEFTRQLIAALQRRMKEETGAVKGRIQEMLRECERTCFVELVYVPLNMRWNAPDEIPPLKETGNWDGPMLQSMLPGCSEDCFCVLGDELLPIMRAAGGYDCGRMAGLDAQYVIKVEVRNP